MRDPKGMLLTRDQRTVRAGALLSTALALALLDRGWKLDARPGRSYLERDGDCVKTGEVVEQMRSGKLSGEAWRARCTELGSWGCQSDRGGRALPNPAQPEPNRLSMPT